VSLSPREYVRHILDEIDYVLSQLPDLELRSFLDNATLKRAFVRSLEIIGEASKHISQDLRSRHPEVPWHVAAAMRDKLIHDYMGVEPAIVWQTVAVSLPDFADQIRAVLRTIDPHQ